MFASRLSAFLAVSLFGLLLWTAPAHPESVASADIDYDEGVEDALETAPYTGPKIVINVAARKLKLYDKDQLVKTYSIAVGSSAYRTPLGDRSMTQIVWNPWWIPPKNSAWAKGAKDTPPGRNNPLGPVKMKLGDAIMVHGTNKPASVGHAASHGCMRMNNEEAKELARYIQEHVMMQTDPALYDTYAKNGGRSYYVNLSQSVPISIVYDIAEIENGELKVYQDVYWKVRDKKAHIESLLSANGYKTEEYDLAYLDSAIKAAKNREDLTFPLNELLIAYRAKVLQTAQVDQSKMSGTN